MNYYNEFDKHAAAWLRELIRSGAIPPGDVDERSIEDVKPNELRGYTQHHFFAGIGGWSHALDLAGWPRDMPVVTGSCPCQSFSVAGKGAGFADKRHLWHAWFHLIRELAPATVFGEQVAAAIRHGWLDLVQTDLEGAGYAFGSAVLGAHSAGAPHIRQRLYFVAESNKARRPGRERAESAGLGILERSGVMGDAGGDGLRVGGWPTANKPNKSSDGTICAGVALGDASGTRLAQQFSERGTPPGPAGRNARQATERAGAPVGAMVQSDSDGPFARHSATEAAGHGRSAESADFWPADWIACRDGKSRPVEPKYVKMVDGLSCTMVPERSSIGKAPEKVDGQAETCGPNQALRSVRETSGAEDFYISAGGQDGILEAQILRSSVHGKMDGGTDKVTRGACRPSSVIQGCVGEMRNLRENGEATCSSQGRKSDEQLPIELSDFVWLLPSSRALALLHGDGNTAEALLAVCKASGAERLLLDAPDKIQEVWRSLGKEVQDRFWMEVRKGGFVRTHESPLIETGAAHSRVMRLRGYGNAICPQTAAAFVRAYMDARATALVELAA